MATYRKRLSRGMRTLVILLIFFGAVFMLDYWVQSPLVDPLPGLLPILRIIGGLLFGCGIGILIGHVSTRSEATSSVFEHRA